MATGTLFYILSTFFGYVAMLGSALCIACGLYCAAELAEEYSSIAKKIITYSLVVVSVFHVLLLISGVSFWTIAISLACNSVYTSLLYTFPYVEVVSFPSISSAIAVLIAHYVWFQFFFMTYTSIFQVTGMFFVVIWAIPCMLFVSLNLADDAMPTSSANNNGMGGGNSNNGGKGGGNVFKTMVDLVMEKYNGFVNRKAPGLRKHY